jgi:succinate-acetate transporter protein
MSSSAPASEAPALQQGLRTEIFLQPIAAPAVLGYFAGASAFLIFGVWLGGGIGGAKAALSFFPFLLLFGGFGQLSAGMLSVRARGAAAAALFMVWGGFWIAYGFLWVLDATGTVKLPAFSGGFEALGQWFIYMAVITWTIAFASLGRAPGEFVSQAVAAAAATIASAGLIAGAHGWQEAAGWVFVAASAMFFYHAAALMLNALYGRVILPHLTWRRTENRPGAVPLEPIAYERGEPGVRVGQ